MENWSKLDSTVDGKAKLHNLLDRSVRRKGKLLKSGQPALVSMARYRTDGITTIAVVTVTSFSGTLASHGYGVSALSPKDKPNEKSGAWIATARALETAVNAYYQTHVQDKTAPRGAQPDGQVEATYWFGLFRRK